MKLSAEDSAEFIRHLFHPTEEEILEKEKIFNEIDKNINIIEEDKDEFIVEAKDLDLSFINEIKKEII